MINLIHMIELCKSELLEKNIYSPQAQDLVMGTMIQESELKHLFQLTSNFSIHKHGVGFGQTEKTTFDWLKEKYLGKYTRKDDDIVMLSYDIRKMILYCRLRYLAISEPLPVKHGSWDDYVIDLAQYWKKYYNTIFGSGTVQQFYDKYMKYYSSHSMVV